MATKRQKKKMSKKRDMILSILYNPDVEQTEKDVIMSLITHKPDNTWSGQAYTPPGTILDKIVRRFERDTDVDLSLPFFITMQLIAGILIKRGVTVSVEGNDTEPAIWVNLLCDSGSCKTFCLGKIKKSLKQGLENAGGIQLDALSADDLIWEPAAVSVAQFMREWAGFEDDKGREIEKCHNRSIMVVDEATDFFESIKNPKGNLYAMYKNFLMAYSHETISYNTASNGKIEIEKPVICFLGLATPGRFIDNISEADIEGGFYYRFGIIVSNEQRPMVGHAIYPNAILDGIDKEWKHLVQSISHRQYIVSDKAIQYFKDSFDAAAENTNFPRAFIRRMSWMKHKFALIYHLVTGHGNEKEIGDESYMWADRLMSVFSTTAAGIIHEKMDAESVQMLKTVERLIERRAENGKETTARDIVMSTKIPTKEAELYLRIAKQQ